MNKKNKKPSPTEKGIETGKTKPSKTDPFGSYTGRAEDPADTPVQDADDL